jgi:hypothetical protein
MCVWPLLGVSLFELPMVASLAGAKLDGLFPANSISDRSKDTFNLRL